MGEDQARVLRRALRKTLREEERFLSRKEERPAWKEAVEGNWRPIAESHGLSREAMRRMASAFDMRRKGRIAP